jgi:CubicO group peptidase (beta-lactamase class C family)
MQHDCSTQSGRTIPSPEPLSPERLARWGAFPHLLDERAPADHVVGAAAVLVQDGRIAARHHYGMADRERGERVGERTIFHYASITKTLTAIAVLQLRDRGRLTLDDAVTRYLPELRQLHDPYGALDRITIRMLLSHSAGFQDPTWPYTEGKAWQPFEPTTWAQLVAMMPYQELLFEPGSRYGYSNPAFIYLARIVEQVTGDPWGIYVQKNIFSPLGMTRSYFGTTPYHLAADRSASYTLVRDPVAGDVLRDNGREFDTGITTPNGGWNAPLDDVAAYLAFLAGSAQGDPDRHGLFDTVLARSSLHEMWRPLYPTGATVPGGRESMGLSFYILEGERSTLVGHAGFQAGFLAFFYLNPAIGAAIAVAFNTNDAAHPEGRSPAYQAVHDAALGVIG